MFLVRTDADEEKQVQRVNIYLSTDMGLDRNSIRTEGTKLHTSFNAEAGNRAGEQTDIGEVTTQVIESR